MLTACREIWTAIRFGGKFAEFFRGVGLEGSEALFRVSSCTRSMRSPGYRFSRYSFSVNVDSPTGTTTGFGESDIEILAVQKAIAEAIERSVLIHQSRIDTTARTSNGWAAHVTLAAAQASARQELLERDSLLLHWFGSVPMDRVLDESLPRTIQRWMKTELALAARYNRLAIFCARFGNAPVVTILIHDDEGKGFLSHSSGATLEGAIERAISEACRLADLHGKGFLNVSDHSEIVSPDDHALFYAEKECLPEWFFSGREISFQDAKAVWREKSAKAELVDGFSFQSFRCGPLYIARCKNSIMQDLFFGESAKALQAGIVNVDRIKRLTGAEEIYLRPHCVA